MLFIEFLGINTPIKQVYGDIAVVKNVTFVHIHKQILLFRLMHQHKYYEANVTQISSEERKADLLHKT